jgi:hypothetical protein
VAKFSTATSTSATSAKKTKGGPSALKNQNIKTIQPLEIVIQEDNSIQFNGRKIKNNAFISEVSKLNSHLSVEDSRNYVIASIIVEKNKSLELAKKLQLQLRDQNVWSSSIIQKENLVNTYIPTKHFNLYSGLTVEEAKVKKDKLMSESVEIDTSSASPWKINVGVSSVEYVDDNGNSTGKIDMNTTKSNQSKELPTIYVNNKALVNPKISMTKDELKSLKLTLSNGTVSNFKLKITGIKTDLVKGNTISSTSIKNLENFNEGTIAIFDIKDDKNNKLPPIIIELKK